jgi:hypothetical protein
LRECGEDLLRLFMDAIAIDEEMILCERAVRKACVTREDDAVLLEGQAQDLVIIQGRVVKDIVTQQPQPLRERAQHDISDKFHGNNPPWRHGGTENFSSGKGKKLKQGNVSFSQIIRPMFRSVSPCLRG